MHARLFQSLTDNRTAPRLRGASGIEVGTYIRQSSKTVKRRKALLVGECSHRKQPTGSKRTLDYFIRAVLLRKRVEATRLKTPADGPGDLLLASAIL